MQLVREWYIITTSAVQMAPLRPVWQKVIVEESLVFLACQVGSVFVLYLSTYSLKLLQARFMVLQVRCKRCDKMECYELALWWYKTQNLGSLLHSELVLLLGVCPRLQSSST